MAGPELLRHLAGDDDLAIGISCGLEHWRGGEITLTVDGSGAVTVVHRRSGAETRYEGTLSPAELSDLAGRFAESGFATPLSERDAYEEDELTVAMEIRRADEVVAQAHAPEGDRYDDSRLGVIMDEFDRLVERVTDGALPYGEAAAPR